MVVVNRNYIWFLLTTTTPTTDNDCKYLKISALQLSSIFVKNHRKVQEGR